jgi:hypothetical protein
MIFGFQISHHQVLRPWAVVDLNLSNFTVTLPTDTFK